MIPILNSYLENMEVDVDTRCTILNYLKLIKKRASGMFDIFGHRLSWHFFYFQLDKTDGSCGCLISHGIIRARDWSVFSGLNLVLFLIFNV